MWFPQLVQGDSKQWQRQTWGWEGVIELIQQTSHKFTPLLLAMGDKWHARDWEYCYEFLLIYEVKPFFFFVKPFLKFSWYTHKNLLIKYEYCSNNNSWNTLWLILQITEHFPCTGVEIYIIPWLLALAGPTFYPESWKENQIFMVMPAWILTMHGKNFSSINCWS